jgi:hypothetical protein
VRVRPPCPKELELVAELGSVEDALSPTFVGVELRMEKKALAEDEPEGKLICPLWANPYVPEFRCEICP